MSLPLLFLIGDGPAIAVTPATEPGEAFVSYEVWLADPSGNLLDVIDEWVSLSYNRAVNNIGALELTLDGTYANPTFIKLDGRVAVYRDGVLDTETTWLIRRVIKTLDETGRRVINVGCVSANEILSRRIVAYDHGTSYASKSDKADSMMKAIVSENFGSSASDTNRSIASYLTVETSASIGPNVTKSFAWNNVLEVIQDISQSSIAAGSAVFFDVVSPTLSTFEFRTYRGRRGLDHSFPNGVAPVVLSPTRGTLTSVLSSHDWSEEVSYVYAGGLGFSQFQFVATASSSDRIGQSPLNRRETFVSAQETAVASAINDEANAALRSLRPKRVFQGELVSVPGATEYNIHWRFGDLVTVEFEGETLDCSIDAVQVKLEEGREMIMATLRVEED